MIHAYMVRADEEALAHGERLLRLYPNQAKEFGQGAQVDNVETCLALGFELNLFNVFFGRGGHPSAVREIDPGRLALFPSHEPALYHHLLCFRPDGSDHGLNGNALRSSRIEQPVLYQAV